MILEPDALEQIEALETTVCIIGAGAAGISLALRFDDTDLPVVLLESGGDDYDEAVQSLYAGDIVGHSYDPLDVARLRYLGGTTNHWNGKCGVFSAKELEGIPDLPDTRWPITFDELLPYYEGAQELCQLGPVSLYGATAKDLVGAAQGAVLSEFENDLSYRVFQRSPPTRFGEVYRPRLKASQNVRVFLHATVAELQTSEDGRQISQALVRSRSGRVVPVRAAFYLLATGGLENPRLLLLSNARDPDGIGNRYDLVGRYFMDHLLVPRAASVVTKMPLNRWRPIGTPTINSTPLTIDLSLTDRFHRENRLVMMDFRMKRWENLYDSGLQSVSALLNALTALSPPEDLSLHLGNIARRRYDVTNHFSRRFAGRNVFGGRAGPYRFDLTASVEQVPSAESRVYLGDRLDRFGQRALVLDWRIAERCYEDLRTTLTHLAKELVLQRIGALQILVESYDAFLEKLQWQWHHMGTTRMSSDPRRGVVDSHCRVHGLENLYIAGSSVFPSGASINPTLTICALALRLADHVKTRV